MSAAVPVLREHISVEVLTRRGYSPTLRNAFLWIKFSHNGNDFIHFENSNGITQSFGRVTFGSNLTFILLIFVIYLNDLVAPR